MAGCNGSNNIRFHAIYPSQWLTNRKMLKAFLSKSLLSAGQEIGELNIIFCSDDYLLDINKRYLNHDDYTDILTFNLEVNSPLLFAEIYISIPRVMENASLFRRPREEELLRVIFHGILHLSNYNDKTSSQKAEMTRMENKWLKRYGDYVSREKGST